MLRAGRGLLNGGCGVLQLRSKAGFDAVDREELLELARLAGKRGVPLIINDFPEVAASIGADGVHVGQDDMPVADVRRLIGPDKIVGKSTHSLEQATAAVAVLDMNMDSARAPPMMPSSRRAGPPWACRSRRIAC